jgi:hypothetical protein
MQIIQHYVAQQATCDQIFFKPLDSRGCCSEQLRELSGREKWMAANEMQEPFAGPPRRTLQHQH